MPLSFQKRSSDAPLLRFLPDEESREPGKLGVESHVSLPVEELRLFEETARKLGSTSENLLLAGFAALLSRLTRQDVVDIAIGSAGPRSAGLRSAGSASGELVSAESASAESESAESGSTGAGHLELARFNLDGECSFQNTCTQTANQRKTSSTQFAEGAANQGAHYEFWSEAEAIPLDSSCGLRLSVTGAGRELKLASPTGSWQELTLRSWLGYLLVFLGEAVRHPDLPVDQLPLWEDSAARTFYSRLNATEVDFPGPSSVVGHFALQAEQRRNAGAVVSDGVRYTYLQLEERSSLLARHLVRKGAGANRAVAVCMERTADLPVALLAVLKSGSFYVPLDPHNPSLRLRGILEECEPVALISDSQTAETLKGMLGAIPLISIDQLDQTSYPSDAAANGTAESVAVAIEPDHLAYTIYTSGTTGKPKGVRINHGALLNLICAMGRSPGSSVADRTLAVAPISFDIATMDMFLPLCSGGTLVIASRSDALDPFRLAQLIEEQDITCMQATPVTWRMLVTSGWSGKRDLKMISGGEALPRELANELLRTSGELWNCYGPTETTIYSAVIQLHPQPGIVPVGPPMPNTSFYVMDKAGNPLPPGVPGELYIGGAGVSPGYVARPELTAQRFVPDRFAANHSGKHSPSLFCTGDLVRLVNGNEFEFFGRLDHQVKLRGFRIELGEIESVLRTHPSLSDAVVVLREDIPGEPRLVAYVIQKSIPATSAALRELAAQSLPEYMLPALIVTLKSYPLSASGKIDRRALPVPESLAGEMQSERPRAEAPVGELESKLLKIFHDVLRNTSIGVTDSFFQFGGYSLLTVRLFSRIDRDLHVRLPISLLFDAPTVRALAKVIQKGISPPVIVPIRPHGRSAPIFIVQSYLLYNAMLEIVEPDRPVYGVRELSDEKEPMSVEERARLFSREILKVNPNGPVYLAGWCAAGTLTVEIARQLRDAGHVVGLVALFDAERPGFAPPSGVGAWFSRFGKKTAFHLRRIRSIPWGERFTYLFEAMARNWDWAVEAYYTAHYHSMLWLQKRFGVSLSEAAFNNVYASLSALKDYSVRPYPGKLNLFRAADVPNFSGMDSTLGWGAIALEGVDVNFVPGDHVSMFKHPHVAGLAERLQMELLKSERAPAAIPVAKG